MYVSTGPFHNVSKCHIKRTHLQWNAEVVQLSALRCEESDEFVLVCLSQEEKTRSILIFFFFPFLIFKFLVRFMGHFINTQKNPHMTKSLKCEEQFLQI